jgi:secreted trypsin-like serine protease
LRYHDGFLCGGSIINTLIILTAAHCVKYKIPGKLSVVAGDHDRLHLEGNKEQFRNVSNIFQHQQYDWDNDLNDIAIITLTTPLEFNEYVNSIALPKAPTDFSGLFV